MSGAAQMTRDTVVVRCPDCGGTREISVRQKRRITNGDRSLLCSLCRTIPLPAEIRPQDRDYWTDRYPMEWIRETAQAIWGDET
jgi:hypothetical protein